MLGLDVDTAWDGDEAVIKFLHPPEGFYALIITDIQMPLLRESIEKLLHKGS